MPFQDPTKLPVDDNQIPGYSATARVDPDATMTLILSTLQDILDTLEAMGKDIEALAGHDTRQAIAQGRGGMLRSMAHDKSTKPRR